MSERLKNQKFQEGLVILLLGIALGAYSLYMFRTAAVKTSWIMSPYLFPLLRYLYRFHHSRHRFRGIDLHR